MPANWFSKLKESFLHSEAKRQADIEAAKQRSEQLQQQAQALGFQPTTLDDLAAATKTPHLYTGGNELPKNVSKLPLFDAQLAHKLINPKVYKKQTDTCSIFLLDEADINDSVKRSFLEGVSRYLVFVFPDSCQLPEGWITTQPYDDYDRQDQGLAQFNVLHTKKSHGNPDAPLREGDTEYYKIDDPDNRQFIIINSEPGKMQIVDQILRGFDFMNQTQQYNEFAIYRHCIFVGISDVSLDQLKTLLQQIPSRIKTIQQTPAT